MVVAVVMGLRLHDLFAGPGAEGAGLAQPLVTRVKPCLHIDKPLTKVVTLSLALPIMILSHRFTRMKDSSLITSCFSALNTTMLSVGTAFALSLWAPATPAALASLDPHPLGLDKPVKVVQGLTCLSWEVSFREMAAENEDWSDFDVAMCDGFAALEEGEMPLG